MVRLKERGDKMTIQIVSEEMEVKIKEIYCYYHDTVRDSPEIRSNSMLFEKIVFELHKFIFSKVDK